VTPYLLEKSRIVTHSQEERNFHIFYEFLKGMRDEEKEKYGLQTADKYFYLNQVRQGKAKSNQSELY
jgi:myosin heavy subunit